MRRRPRPAPAMRLRPCRRRPSASVSAGPAGGQRSAHMRCWSTLSGSPPLLAPHPLPCNPAPAPPQCTAMGDEGSEDEEAEHNLAALSQYHSTGGRRSPATPASAPGQPPAPAGTGGTGGGTAPSPQLGQRPPMAPSEGSPLLSADPHLLGAWLLLCLLGELWGLARAVPALGLALRESSGRARPGGCALSAVPVPAPLPPHPRPAFRRVLPVCRPGGRLPPRNLHLRPPVRLAGRVPDHERSAQRERAGPCSSVPVPVLPGAAKAPALACAQTCLPLPRPHPRAGPQPGVLRAHQRRQEPGS